MYVNVLVVNRSLILVVLEQTLCVDVCKVLLSQLRSGREGSNSGGNDESKLQLSLANRLASSVCMYVCVMQGGRSALVELRFRTYMHGRNGRKPLLGTRSRETLCGWVGLHVMSCGDWRYCEISKSICSCVFLSCTCYSSSCVAFVCIVCMPICVHFCYDLAGKQFLLLQIGLLSQLFFHCAR